MNLTILLAARGGLSGADYLVVLLYLAVMLAMGFYFAGRQTSSEEYFVGRGRLPSLVVGISIVATLMSTITYLAAPGDMIQHGLAFATGILSLPFWLAIVLRYWVPFFMRYRFTSIYEYVALRFNHAARMLTATLFICMRLGWMGMIIYTAGKAIASMTPEVPSWLSDSFGLAGAEKVWLYALMLAMGAVATVYTFLGGIRVVIWTDVLQFVVMMGGAIFAVAYVWYTRGDGPLVWWENASSLERAAPVWIGFESAQAGESELSAAVTGGGTWFNFLTAQRTVLFVMMNAFFWRICTHCSDQVAMQRYFTAGDTKGALRSNVVCALGDFALTALLAIVGLALLSLYTDASATAVQPGVNEVEAFALFEGDFNPQDTEDAKAAYPVFIVNFMPAGLAGLVMAALFAAAMSSIDSGINSISAVVTIDFYRTMRAGLADGASEMRVARRTTLVTGAVSTLVAFFVAALVLTDPDLGNIIDLSIKVFNLFLGPLAAVFIAGIFLPHVGSAAVISATILGIALSVVMCYWQQIFGVDWEPAPLLVTPTGTVLTVFLAAVLGVVFPSPTKESIAGHTWWTRHLIREPEDDRTADKV